MNRKNFFVLTSFIIGLLFTVHFTCNQSQINNLNQIITNEAPLKHLNSGELPIGIFYDVRYTEPWNFNAQLLTSYLNQTLLSYDLQVSVLNATALRSFMEDNAVGIIIMTMGIAPDTIWNGSEESFVETWLDGGGIIVWTGCQEFYWVGYETGVNVPIGKIGSIYVMDMDYVETISDQNMIPTQLGNDLFLNISSHTTDVFSSIPALTAANVYFEVYAKKGDWGDPILFQPKNGKGYFVRIHADWNDQLSTENLSTWISAYLNNRFFKLPIVTEVNNIETLFFLSSEELFINVTNYSENFGAIWINSSSNGFEPIETALLIRPNEEIKFNFIISPLTTSRFQKYDFQINLFSNYTDSQNNSKLMLFFTKILSISIQIPLSIEILEINENLYPGGIYTLSLNIQKFINDSIPVKVVLICDGCTNEQKTNINLEKNNTLLEITFSIQMMAKSGLYELIIRLYNNDILLTRSDLSIQVLSIFQNPLVQWGFIVLATTIVTILCIYLWLRRKRKALSEDKLGSKEK